MSKQRKKNENGQLKKHFMMVNLMVSGLLQLCSFGF